LQLRAIAKRKAKQRDEWMEKGMERRWGMMNDTLDSAGSH